jgi:hypothetical protein
MKKLFTGVVVIIGLVSTIGFRQGATSELPFIYYYSGDQQVFIIERIDGSDSRRLPEHTFEQPNGFVIGPGWSSSGTWLAWAYSIGAATVNELFAMNTEGQVRRILDEDDYKLGDFQWSPEHDVLSVEVYGQFESDQNETALVLVDFTTQQTIMSVPSPYELRHLWLTTGEHVVIQKTHTDTFEVMNLDGISTDFEGRLPRWMGTYDVPSKAFIAENLAIIQEPSGSIAIADLLKGTTTTVSPPVSELLCFADWSPDHAYALLYFDDSNCPYLESDLSVYLYHSASNSLSPIAEDVDNPFHLTEQDTAWSSEREMAWLVTIDENDQRHLLLINPESDQVSTIHEEIIEVNLFPSVVEWSNDGQTLWFLDGSGTEWYQNNLLAYDVSTQNVHPLSQNQPIWAWLFSQSPDQEHILYFVACSPEQWGEASFDSEFCIFDISTQEITPLPSSDVPGYFEGNTGGIGGKIRWNRNGKFALICEQENDPICEELRVVDIETAVVRDLGGCSTSASCFGWLPESEE